MRLNRKDQNASRKHTGEGINPLFRADGWVLLLYVMLLTFGWFSVCGASHNIGDTEFLSWSSRTGKQLVWIGCSLGLGAMLLMIEERYYETLAGIFYGFMMVVLLITPFLAHDIKGSRSWISLGPISLQPAEFAKCATALAIAKLLGQYGFTLTTRRNFIRAAGIVLLPFVLIVMQKETGSALVYSAFFLMFYREGMPGSILFCAVAAVAYFVIGIGYSLTPLPGTTGDVGEFVVLNLIWIFVVGMLRIYLPRQPEHPKRIALAGLGVNAVAYLVSAVIYPFDLAWALVAFDILTVAYLGWMWLGHRVKEFFLISVFAFGSMTFLYSSDYALNHVMKDYQRTRICVLLGIENDRDAAYNVNQSKIAIGSGGLTGKGFMKGTQTKLDYVPEQDTDFIFCTVGEEEGFIGASSVLLLFLALILRILVLAERQVTTFGRVYGYCVLSILLFHVFINIGMVTGLAPVIGIPLPFFSYGGSSLWGFTILLFIFLRIDAGRKKR
ncbi:MAG: rod shape-determining protein RodA [Bacteroidales bacterium]|nr:rod shape-determining protein RodA [Bacteroidales bacterium]